MKNKKPQKVDNEGILNERGQEEKLKCEFYGDRNMIRNKNRKSYRNRKLQLKKPRKEMRSTGVSKKRNSTSNKKRGTKTWKGSEKD